MEAGCRVFVVAERLQVGAATSLESLCWRRGGGAENPVTRASWHVVGSTRMTGAEQRAAVHNAAETTGNCLEKRVRCMARPRGPVACAAALAF